MKFCASKRLSAAIVVLALATLACNFGKPLPAATQETELPPTQTAQPENNDQGLCSNPLYPVKMGGNLDLQKHREFYWRPRLYGYDHRRPR